ncbi:MAG: multidrug effflux MFS transporter [Gammaproteobacteria bacterium]|jgi:DHA1 family bicyclomycin/chloramphenicol resistance-like MFS transporter|nr:multidrug effflux MFS transporter [Gammaproteobacteria bacterium]MBT5216350.1 multidrug effflux MFS transporter [Gammaproteobacteria bacterium]MBT5541840.1 multidrug effflux MFS transporter [Gammaproteobacteria bacterium]MBT6074814.1 multidrug effflux MFS transporter [Gammaproteobacteria bacterium]MBT7754462.1 multidrug effflux MFS transporter [Gammaproteobacteria bacterium]
MKSLKPSSLLLGFAAAMSPFGMAIVVPTLELFAQEYQAPYSTIQFIISAYLFGLATAQPLVGYLSDRIGRRPVMIGGILLFIIASVMCLITENLNTLISYRFLQGVGGSVGTVMARAMIRDTMSGEESAKPLSRVMAFMGMAPMIAPVAGAFATSLYGDPKGIFFITLIIGVIILISVLLKLPETRKIEHSKIISNEPWHDKYKYLLGSKVFIGSTFMYGFTTGSFFSILAVGSTVFSVNLGIDSTGFGLIWSSMTILYASSAFLSGNLSASLGLIKVMRIGVLVNLVSGVMFFSLIAIFGVTIYTIIFPLIFMFIGHGFIVPSSMTKAVSDRPEIAGSSSGLSSALGLVTGGLFSILSGALYTGSFLPISFIVMVSTILCYLCYFLVSKDENKA